MKRAESGFLRRFGAGFYRVSDSVQNDIVGEPRAALTGLGLIFHSEPSTDVLG
jgi:hypothetical protein